MANGMDYQVSRYFQTHGFKPRDIEKARIYEFVLSSGGISRKKLSQRLEIRPNNVSEAVQQLVDDNLMIEIPDESKGKGRPEILLHARRDRLVSIAVGVSSDYLTAALIDMAGYSLLEKDVRIPAETDNLSFYERLVALISEVVARVGRTQILVGIGIAVPGVVSENGGKWVFNSTWPVVSNLDLSRLPSRFHVPVTVFRFLDAELNALILKHERLRNASVLLVHWGYGIGASFCQDGVIPSLRIGSIGEMGHMKVNASDSTLQCKCGEKGCLETVASGWALRSRLEPLTGKFPTDEKKLGRVLEDLDLSSDEAIQRAVAGLAKAIDITYRFYPADKIIIYGPFMANQDIRIDLVSLVRAKLPWYSKDCVDIEVGLGEDGEATALGSCAEFFRSRLEKMLVFRNVI